MLKRFIRPGEEPDLDTVFETEWVLKAARYGFHQGPGVEESPIERPDICLVLPYSFRLLGC